MICIYMMSMWASWYLVRTAHLTHVWYTLAKLENLSMHDVPPRKTKMTMEHPPFEDVFPIENGDVPMSCVSFQGCNNIECIFPSGDARIHPGTPKGTKSSHNNANTPWQKTCGKIPEPNRWSPIPISDMRHTIPRRDAFNGSIARSWGARLPGFGLGKLLRILSFT